MPMNSTRVAVRAVPAILLAALLAGCAAVEPRPPEDVVAERAQARWAALLDGDIEEAHQYYAPGYRDGVSVDSIRARMKGSRLNWREVELEEIECSESLCRPVFMVRYDYRSPLPRVGTVNSAARLEERWIREGGNWYYVPTDVESEGLR